MGSLIASTVSLPSASRIFAICCARNKGTTMRGERRIEPISSHRHRRPPTEPSATGLAVVAAMTITKAITIKRGSVPRLTCRSALHMGAFTSCG